jgi:hypothetical protein
MAMGFGLYNQGLITSRGKKCFLHSVPTGSGTHPASYQVGIGALSQSEEWLDHEADHSPPSGVDVKKSYTSTSQYIFIAWCLFN